MKRKFKPYLDIKDKEHLRLLLYRQFMIEENVFPEAEVEDFTEEAFRNLAEKFKNFYGYRPSKEYADYINDIIYFLLVNKYFITVFDLASESYNKMIEKAVVTSQTPVERSIKIDPKKPDLQVLFVGEDMVSLKDENDIIAQDTLDSFSDDIKEFTQKNLISLFDGTKASKMLQFLAKNFDDIDSFIIKYYGKGFYSLDEACPDTFNNIDMNDSANLKIVLEKIKMILSKAQTVLFLLGTYVKQLRFHMIISILTSKRIDILVKSLLPNFDELYDLFKKLKNTKKLHEQ